LTNELDRVYHMLEEIGVSLEDVQDMFVDIADHIREDHPSIASSWMMRVHRLRSLRLLIKCTPRSSISSPNYSPHLMAYSMDRVTRIVV